MLNKLKLFLFPALVKGFDINAADRDGDGLVQEGTQYERKLKVTTEKKAPVKKVAKKAPVKKTATVKKTAPKKTTKKK